ncbi:hypothetical protein [Marinimicrobium sp. ABcell2]|uniref:hypothetical protein n=1 Tax=Marinimicrobium sp. ABcell2 TaxID=3069751 RepID=UPI0027B72E14|nr:hypothetical protein [Marinimicrobium sp. ABcell2]MDQ2076013.1 hypothetical protein [Marinimicrobium sp. ABcell2]
MSDDRPNSEQKQLKEKLKNILKRNPNPGHEPADEERGVFDRPLKRQKLEEDAPEHKTRDGR